MRGSRTASRWATARAALGRPCGQASHRPPRAARAARETLACLGRIPTRAGVCDASGAGQIGRTAGPPAAESSLQALACPGLLGLMLCSGFEVGHGWHGGDRLAAL